MTSPFLVFFFMSSSKNKAFLSTGPPSSPGKDVSLLEQVVIHPSEGFLSSAGLFLSSESAFNQLLTGCQLRMRAIYTKALVA